MPCATRPLPLLLALPLGLLSALLDFLLFALSFATIYLPKPADSCTNGLMRVPLSAIFDGESLSPGYSENSKLTRGPPDEAGRGWREVKGPEFSIPGHSNLYSPNRVEGKFWELRIDAVLGSSRSQSTSLLR